MSFVSSSSSRGRSGGGGSYGPRRDSVKQLLSRAKPVARAITAAVGLFAFALPVLLLLIWLFGISINAPAANLAVVQSPPGGTPEPEDRQGSTLLTIDAVAPQPWESGQLAPLQPGMWGTDKTWVYIRRGGPAGEKLPFALLGHVPQRVLLAEGSYEIDVVYAPRFRIKTGQYNGPYSASLPLVSARSTLDVTGRRQTERVTLQHFHDEIPLTSAVEARGMADFVAAIATARIRPSVAVNEVVANLPDLAETALSSSDGQPTRVDWTGFTRAPHVYASEQFDLLQHWLYTAAGLSAHLPETEAATHADFGAAQRRIENVAATARYRPGLWTWLGVALAGLILGRSTVITVLERDYDLWWYHALLTLLAAAVAGYLIWIAVSWML